MNHSKSEQLFRRAQEITPRLLRRSQKAEIKTRFSRRCPSQRGTFFGPFPASVPFSYRQWMMDAVEPWPASAPPKSRVVLSQ